MLRNRVARSAKDGSTGRRRVSIAGMGPARSPRWLAAAALAAAAWLAPSGAAGAPPDEDPMPVPPPWPGAAANSPAGRPSPAGAAMAARAGAPRRRPESSALSAPAAPPSPPPGGTAGGRGKKQIGLEAGRVTPFATEDGTLAVVLLGNPRITGRDGLSIKAHTIVAWIDPEKAPELKDLFGAPEGGQPGDGAGAGPEGAEGGASKPGAGTASSASSSSSSSSSSSVAERPVVPEALVAVYAEGAVELVTGEKRFRAWALYLDARTNRALLIEPRYETELPVKDLRAPVPIHVRARRARIVAAGTAVFDRAELSTSRATDRIELQVRTLTIEEYGKAASGEPLFLGFRTTALSQRFRVEGMVVRGERLPLVYWPEAAFGGEEIGALREFPVRIRRVTAGSRSSLGRYGFLGIGGVFGPERHPWLDVTVDVGGYTKRGPAAGLDAKWTQPTGGAVPMRGRLQAFYVDDGTGDDRSGQDAPVEDRWIYKLENRLEIAPRLRLDVEANDFSDRGVNREFFESDERNHRDRETYARLRWMRGGAGATLVGKARLRPFVTETTEEPQGAFWSESVPLFPGAAGLPGVDLSTRARAGRLARRFDEALPDEEYEAFRTDVEERLYAPFDVGDVRVSPFAGGRWTGYTDRTDGGPDVSRTALEAGIRGNLQLHRDYAAYGGPLGLDGVRHVIDLDAGVVARFEDSHDPDDVPFFDLIDAEEERTEWTFQVRSRLDTRRALPGGRAGNVTVVDAAVRLSLWDDDVGPYGQRAPGELKATVAAELLPGILFTRGEAVWGFDPSTLDRASVGVSYSPVEWFSVAGGIRHVRDEARAVWFDGYLRWSDKWASRVSAIHDFLEGDRNQTLRVSLLRHSPDHVIEVGVTVRHGGEDVGFYVDFEPAIGGSPLAPPFDPREEIDFGP